MNDSIVQPADIRFEAAARAVERAEYTARRDGQCIAGHYLFQYHVEYDGDRAMIWDLDTDRPVDRDTVLLDHLGAA